MKAYEIRDAILNNEFESFSDLIAYITDLDFNQVTINNLVNLQCKQNRIRETLELGILPTLFEIEAHNIEIQEIIDSIYSGITYDYARPIEYMRHLESLCAIESEKDLLRFTIFAYDNDKYKFGAIAPLCADTKSLLDRIIPDAYFVLTN